MAKEKNHPTRVATDRQRSVTPPDVIRNVAKFDAALWTGKGINSLVQKCGIVVLGLFFFGAVASTWRWLLGSSMRVGENTGAQTLFTLLFQRLLLRFSVWSWDGDLFLIQSNAPGEHELNENNTHHLGSFM